MSLQFAAEKAMFLVRWGKTVEAPDVQTIHSAISKTQELAKAPIVYISVIPDGSKPPPPELRRALMEVTKPADFEHIFAVVEMKGIMGGVARTVIAGMLLLVSGMRAKVSVVENIEQVVALLRTRNHPDPECATRLYGQVLAS